jgi:hypothetical protein
MVYNIDMKRVQSTGGCPHAKLLENNRCFGRGGYFFLLFMSLISLSKTSRRTIARTK